jgi:ribonuclease G
MKQILINRTSAETRFALLENGKVIEVQYERLNQRKIVGNIYRGRVVRVLPGIQAAFVDIGLNRTGYLYVDEALSSWEGEGKEKPNIREIVREGQEIIVQVSKEAFGSKGPRLTTKISLPGRYLVYMPFERMIGISRRIDSLSEQERLRKLAERIKEDHEGILIRTNGERVGEEALKDEYLALRNLWVESLERSKGDRAPCLIHEDLGVAHKVLRDYLDDEVSEILIDDVEEYRNLLHSITMIGAQFKERIKLYRGKTDLFSAYQVETEIQKALHKRVNLKSGGFLIIEHTEALTIIDVNTGKFVGKDALSQTVLKTNLEAAEEIPRQLRLRNIGGIILIDFIDMHLDSHKEQILTTLKREMNRDPMKSQILGITALGLVEMTRKKVKENLQQTLTSTCPCCNGNGWVRSLEMASAEIEREIRQYRHSDIKGFTLEVHPDLLSFLQSSGLHSTWEEVLGMNIILKENMNLRYNHYAISRTH